MKALALAVLGFLAFGCNQPQQPTVALEQNEVVEITGAPLQNDNCAAWTQNLSTCTPYACEYMNSYTKMHSVRIISGLKNGLCTYNEELAANRTLQCMLPLGDMSNLAQYYQKVEVSDTDTVTVTQNADGTFNYNATLDQQMVPTPLQAALNNGSCKIIAEPAPKADGFEVQFGSGPMKENIVF